MSEDGRGNETIDNGMRATAGASMPRLSSMPCPVCRQFHLLDEFTPGARVKVAIPINAQGVAASPGAMGTVNSWSQYGTDQPMYYRVFTDLKDAHGDQVRISAFPCQLEGVSQEIVNQVIFAVCNVHDRSELWADTRRDPRSFQRAVRAVLERQHFSR